MKKQEFETLIKKLGKCNKCTNLKSEKKSLINIFEDSNFCINIPSIWTDWLNRLDSKIIIIGQDWGPYSDMVKLNKMLYGDKSNWEELIECEKSSTKKLLNYYIKNLLVISTI